MKRLIFLLFAFAATAGYAQDNGYSMLKLRLNDSSRIAVEVDGHYVDRQTSSLTLDGLPPGSHRIEVYGMDGDGKRRVRIYTGTIRVKPGSVNFGVVDVYRRSLGVHSRPRNAQDEHGYAAVDNKQTQDESHSGLNQAPVDQAEVTPDKNEPQADEGSIPKTQELAPLVPGVENGLPTSEMAELHTRVESLAGDTEKEALMKKSLENRRISTDQLRGMLHWFDFESTRLSFAEWAYSRVGDQHRYPELEDVFEYEASKKEFQKTFGGDK